MFTAAFPGNRLPVISVLSLGADRIGNRLYIVEVCLPSRCLATFWPSTLQYFLDAIELDGRQNPRGAQLIQTIFFFSPESSQLPR
jgi:hypothetical protein